MKILILNGNSSPENEDFDQYLSGLSKTLQRDRNEVEIIILRDKKITSCTGCWSCWVKTPGKCSVPDDSDSIRMKYIHAQMVIFASPLSMGFVSAVMKKTMDKLIPLLHPYITLVNNECHHQARYEKYPLIGLIYQDVEKDPDYIQITESIFRRFALNFKTDLAFSFSIKKQVLEVINEIDSY